MDHMFFDEYDYYNFGSNFDKIVNGSGTGHAKHKSNKIDNQKYAPSGHVRKVVTKLQNSEKKKKEEKIRRNSSSF